MVKAGIWGQPGRYTDGPFVEETSEMKVGGLVQVDFVRVYKKR